MRMKIPEDIVFITFPDLEQKTFWFLAKCFSTLLSKLHFASSVNHFDVFSEHFPLLTNVRCLSTKILDFWIKGFETIVKMVSTCTDEHNEMKLLFGEKFLLFYDFWSLGIIKRTLGGKRNSAHLSDLASTSTEGHLVEKALEWNNILYNFFVIRASNFPNTSKTSGTFVKLAFHLHMWSFCSESNFCQKYLFFYPFWSKRLKL